VLLNLVPDECRLNLHLSVEQVQPLNRYSMEARYPGDWDPIDLQEATDAIRMARGVQQAVRIILPEDALK